MVSGDPQLVVGWLHGELTPEFHPPNRESKTTNRKVGSVSPWRYGKLRQGKEATWANSRSALITNPYPVLPVTTVVASQVCLPLGFISWFPCLPTILTTGSTGL